MGIDFWIALQLTGALLTALILAECIYRALFPKTLTKPTESGASDKCASDGGTCGLGGQCADCPHKESGASE